MHEATNREARRGRDDQRKPVDRLGAWVAERFVVRGSRTPVEETSSDNAIRGEGPGDWETYQLQ